MKTVKSENVYTGESVVTDESAVCVPSSTKCMQIYWAHHGNWLHT